MVPNFKNLSDFYTSATMLALFFTFYTLSNQKEWNGVEPICAV